MSNQQSFSPFMTPKLENFFELDKLCFVKDAPKSVSNLKLHTVTAISEYFELKKAAKLNITAVYFKRFSGQPSLPQIYVCDLKQEHVTESNLGELHRKIWNIGTIPLVYIFTKTEVKIFNCMKQPIKSGTEFIPSYIKQFSIKEILSSGAKIQKGIEEYSSKSFENGHFWNTKDAKYLESKNTVYESLKKGLVRLRDKFIEKIEYLSKQSAQRLLLQCILIKYLEEREDEKGNHVFPNNYFNRYGGAENFCDVLRKGYCLDLFDDLHRNQFNGEIFSWNLENDREAFQNENLSELANFLDANIEEQQYVLWRLYSFEYLPVEFISSIYDEFIGNNQEGVVYTPPHLAKFLVDECMPINEPHSGFKVLDPCCGSGIFLVTAFKRLIQWWHILNPDKEFNSQNIQPILANNIFGVDKNIEAIQLTIFSLSLALCDELSPKEIWFNLKFNNLQNNIVGSDFFEWKKKCQIQFDLVIGNPPFIGLTKITPVAKQFVLERNNLPQIPDTHGMTLLFMEQSYKTLKQNGLLCLIMPAPILLYRDETIDIVYRKALIKNYNIAQIIDFTPLRRVLFSTTITNQKDQNKRDTTIGVAALFIQKNVQQQESNILHLVVRRTKSAKEKLFFELDEYDFHHVNKQTALNYPFIWKVNLLGGGRLFHIIQRLHDEFPKLYTFISSSTSITRAKPKSAQSLDYLVIKKNIGKYGKHPAKLIRSTTPIPKGYETEIIKIYSKTGNSHELQHLQNYLNENNIYSFYPLCTSGRAGTGQSFSTILPRDIYNLPYEQDRNYRFNSWEEIIIEDTLKYQLDFFSLAENSIILHDVKKQQLEEFGKTFCNMLNPTYQNGEYQFYQGQIIDASSFICNTFHYGKVKDSNRLEVKKDLKLENNIRKLTEQKQESLQINRVIRIYQKNTLYLIKPKQLRYWLRSIAIRDADKTVSDLIDRERV